jgi:hypothetical protein
MIIDLSQCWAAPDWLSNNNTYGDAFSDYAQGELPLELPEDLSTIDVDTLLSRISSLSSEI